MLANWVSAKRTQNIPFSKPGPHKRPEFTFVLVHVQQNNYQPADRGGSPDGPLKSRNANSWKASKEPDKNKTLC